MVIQFEAEDADAFGGWFSVFGVRCEVFGFRCEDQGAVWWLGHLLTRRVRFAMTGWKPIPLSALPVGELPTLPKGGWQANR